MDAITFIPDESSREPLYLQVYKHLAQCVRDGKLQDGERLPSKRFLASHLKISMSTVEMAYDMLVTQGYATARPRSGYYANGIAGIVPDRPHPVDETDGHIAGAPDYTYDFGTDAVDTSAFPYSTWSKITREVMSDGGRLLARGDIRGDECLRAAIATYLREFRDVSCEPEQLVVGAGMEYLMGLIAGITGTGFAVENPCYSATVRILENLNIPFFPIPLDRDGMSEQELARSPADIAYITPSHQFPTGIVMPVARRLRLLQWAAHSPGRYLIEDDYDSEFRYSGRPIPSLQGMDQAGRVIYVGTFSRSIAPSVRIAYMVLPYPLMRRFMEKYGTYSSTVSRFEQHTLSRFISEGYFARHINRMRLIYRRRRDTAIQALEGMDCPPVGIYGEQAGIHLIVSLRPGLEAERIIRTAAQRSVRVLPFASYYIRGCPPQDRNKLILNFAGMDEQKIREGIHQLDLAVRQELTPGR